MMGVASECQGEPDTCEITLGVGAGDGNPVNNLYINVYTQPNETMDVSGLAKILHADGTGYTGFDAQVNIIVTGNYRVRPNGLTDQYWYRAQFTLSIYGSTTGWITQTDMAYALENAATKSCSTLNSLPVGLPEQDRSGVVVYTIVYAGATVPMRYAPVSGNIYLNAIQARNDRVLRIRAHAENPSSLGGGTWLHGYRWDSDDTPIDGWIYVETSTGISLGDIQSVQAVTSDRTSDYGGLFETAQQSSQLPNWLMPPTFVHYPISGASACAASNLNIDGLGYPFDTALYGIPGYHTGVDFFAPDGASVFSIGDNGLVVGIGVGKYNAQTGGIEGIDFSSHEWGSAGIEPDERGYAIIVRYGHLYVLYGHFSELEPNIFVGAPIDAGDRIGQIGSFNDPHVHIEIRNFDDPIPAGGLQPSPMNQYGFLSFSSTGEQRAQNHYDVVQFFDINGVIAHSDDSQQPSSINVTGLGVGLADGDDVFIGGLCTREYRSHASLPTVNDPVLGNGIRGFVLGQTNTQLPPILPSDAPSQP